MENESCYVCNYAKHEINRGVKEVRCGLNNRFVAYPKLGCSNCKKTYTTNADRIRQMTDEELADVIGFNECKDTAHGYECPALIQLHCGGECKKHFLAWLKQEVKTDD